MSLEAPNPAPYWAVRVESVQRILNAFLGLLTQPLGQNLGDSVRAATMAIVLAAGLQAWISSSSSGGYGAQDTAVSSLVLVLVWMATTAVVSGIDRRRLTMARNLSLLSFWIAVALVFILAAKTSFRESSDLLKPVGTVSVALLVLVPVHLLRSLPFGLALRMTVALWFSMAFLVWRVFY